MDQLAAAASVRVPSVTEILDSLPSDRFDPLVSHQTNLEVRRLAAAFPVPVQTLCYESRLGEGVDRTDLALCLVPGLLGGAGDGLRNIVPLHGPAESWLRCIRFLRSWAAPASALLPQIPFVWVAFDLDRPYPALPVPCLGVCVDDAFFLKRLGWHAHSSRSPHELIRLADDCYQRLFADPLPSALHQRLESCLAIPEVEAKHFSFMLSRKPATFKLDVALNADDLPHVLDQVGWRGPTAVLAREVRAFMPSGGRLQVNLVLHPEVSPPLEVEYLTAPHAAGPHDRLALLDRLVAAGLASPAKANVLREVTRAPVTDGPDGQRIARGWYVKVRFDAAGPVEAKVYLGLMPRPAQHFDGSVGSPAVAPSA